MYSTLYLVYSAGHCSPTYVLIPLGVWSYNVQPYQLFQLYPIRVDSFPFPSMYGPPYPTFQSHPVLLPSDVLLALLLVGDLSHLCIFYHNCKGWSEHSSWPCWILLVVWPGRDTSGVLNNLWILSWCYMDYISFWSFRLVLWHSADIPWWVFGYCPLSSYLGFLEPMLCTLGSCYDGGCISDKSFLLDMHQYR